MAVERDAKITVRIATDEALAALDKLDAETKERREAREAEEKRRREDGRQQPEKADDARSAEERDAGPRATNAGRGEDVRGLSGSALLARGRDFAQGPGAASKALVYELLGVPPLVGGALQGAAKTTEFGARYGPAALAALRPFVPEDSREVFDKTADAVRSGARAVAKIDAAVSAVDATTEQLKAMAVTSQLWGVPAKWSGLGTAGARLYQVNYALDMKRRTRDAILHEAAGAAVGNLLGSALHDAYGGGAR